MVARRKQEVLGARDTEVTPCSLGTICTGPAGLRGSLRQREDVNRAPSCLSLRWARGRLRRVPMGRVGTPAEIAYGVLYLASDESSFVTGSELVIDGGYIAQ